jgi:hypothetical protein
VRRPDKQHHPEITAITNYAKGDNPPKFALILWVQGKHPLRNALLSYQDRKETESIKDKPMTLEQLQALAHFVPLDDGGTGTILPGPHILRDTYLPAGHYVFIMPTAAGNFGEEMTLTITGPGKLTDKHTVEKNRKIITQWDGDHYVVEPPVKWP